MIAEIANGLTGSREHASRSIMDSLRSLPGDSPPAQSRASGQRLNVDGGTGLSKARRRELPVVLLPVFREFAPGLQGLVDLVHGLQQASLAFRVVVLTDLGDFRALRSYGWAIVHVSSEAFWDTQRGPWSQYVRNEAISAVKEFLCIHTLDVQKQRLSDESWNFLLLLCGLNMDQPAGPNDCTSSQRAVHYSWRGWIGEVPDGESYHELNLESGVWRASIYRANAGSIVLIDANPKRMVGAESFELAVRRGWNICKIVCEQGDDRPADRERIVSAMFDGLSLESAGVSSYSLIGSSIAESGTNNGKLPSVGRADILAAERKAVAEWSVNVWTEEC